MKKILFYLLGIVALSASLSGCSGINRLIKGGDPEAIYAKGVELYDAGKWSKAITLLQNVENYYSGTSKADTLSFYIARAHFKNRSYDTASELFDTYRRTFGRSPFIEDAEGMYAMCFYYLSPSPQRDQTVTGQAIVAISEFMSRYPDSEKYGQFEQMRNELTGRLHDKEFLNAYTYYKIGKHKSAIVALKNALRKYPETPHREELMYLIEDSPFSLFLWLKNSGALGVEQYRKKNLLTLDFAYVTDPRAMKREGIVPGQELSLKMGYVMLAYILKVEKVPDISWKGRASAGDHRVDLEIAGEFEEMTVPIHIRVTELTEEGLVPVKRTFMPFMEGGKQIPYLEYPVESILAENLFYLIRDMELLPDMSVYDKVYGILKTEPVDGRHIQELLGEHCKKQQLLPEESRMKEILSYRDYSYMRKRWEKYLRHRKRKEPAWTEVMQVLEQFLPQMWSTLCRDEIFFGDWMPDLQRFLD